MNGGRASTIAWTGVVAPALIWSAHLVVCYAVVTSVADWKRTGVQVALLLITLGALSLVAGSTVVVRRMVAGANGAMGFLGRLATWSGSLFLVAILLTVVPIYALGDLL